LQADPDQEFLNKRCLVGDSRLIAKKLALHQIFGIQGGAELGRLH
jgi:hypothetical protein